MPRLCVFVCVHIITFCADGRMAAPFFFSPSLKIRVEKYVGEWVQYRPQLLPDIRKLCCTAHNNLLHSQFIHYLLAIFPPICCCMLLLMLVLCLCCLRAQHVFFGRMWVAEGSPPSASDALAFQWAEGREPPRRLVSDYLPGLPLRQKLTPGPRDFSGVYGG